MNLNHKQQIALALQERDLGIGRVATKNGTFLETMRGVARRIARQNGTVTADDLREYVEQHPEIEQPSHYNAWGAVFSNALDFEFVGYTKSRQPQGHGNLIRVWRERGIA